jgi:hypothetical protein
VAFGSAAHHAIAQWPGKGALPVFELMHPSAMTSSGHRTRSHPFGAGRSSSRQNKTPAQWCRIACAPTIAIR